MSSLRNRFQNKNTGFSKKITSLNEETIKNICLLFYPKEDMDFFKLMFSPMDNSTFIKELEKYYKNLTEFSDENPDNKFYGVQKLTKIPKNRDKIEEIELNKTNTDLIFVLVKEILLSSYEEEIDKITLIKSQINEIFNCNGLNTISFISNKLDNYTSILPANFYAFCVTIKILIMCYQRQLKFYHIGIFMESEQTLFNKHNNECFLSELFCCYMSFLYLVSNGLKNESGTLCLHFWNDSNIFESFTFHMNDNGYNLLKKVLPEKENYDILEILKDIFSDTVYRMQIFLHYNISNDRYKQIIEFLNLGELPKKIDIFCDTKFINNKNVNLFKDLQNCKELNIHIIVNTTLLNTTAINKINLKDGENINIKRFSIEGKNLYIEDMPKNMSKIKSLELISKKVIYFMNDDKEYKNLYNNLCFNFPKDFFINFNYLEDLSLKYITPEQFFTLISCLNSTEKQSMIYNLYLEINYSHLKIPNILNNDISKAEILRGVDSLIRDCKRILDIRKLDIILANGNPQNNFLLTKENGFYFISLVLEVLKRCYHFNMNNINYYYYPSNDTNPNVNIRAAPANTNGTRTRNRNQRANKQAEENKINEEFSLEDDVHNCIVQTNKNKDLQVIYNGIKEEDNSQIVDLNSTIPFLYVVKKKLVKLQPKTILNSILKFFEYQFNAPKQFSVCNYNN